MLLRERKISRIVKTTEKLKKIYVLIHVTNRHIFHSVYASITFKVLFISNNVCILMVRRKSSIETQNKTNDFECIAKSCAENKQQLKTVLAWIAHVPVYCLSQLNGTVNSEFCLSLCEISVSMLWIDTLILL